LDPPPQPNLFSRDPPTQQKKKYGFTPTTNRKIKKMAFPTSQVDLNGIALNEKGIKIALMYLFFTETK
jgi:hypothetical protein